MGEILVLRSDDGGASWWQYALGSTINSNGLVNISAYRWVQSDGAIAGTFTLGNSPNTVYTFRVTPN